MSHDPYKELWVAVINEALRVCGLHQDYLAGRVKAPPQCVSEHEIAQEWSFLTAKHGEWASSRRDVCAAAGIDPCFLRERVLAASERGELRSLYPGDLRVQSGNGGWKWKTERL